MIRSPIAGVRYLDIRPAYYKADALSDVSSGYYTAHWSTFGAGSWVGLIGRSLDNVCQDLTTAMSLLGKGEVVLLEISHGKYLPEALSAKSLSEGQQKAIISQLLTALGDHAFKWSGSNTPPFNFLSQKLSDVIQDPTASGPVAFLWDSDGDFASCGFGPAQGYFSNSNLDYHNSWDDADTGDPTTLINDLTASLKKNVAAGDYLLAWHCTGGPGYNLQDLAGELNPLFTDSVANWFGSGIIGASVLPTIAASDFVSSDTTDRLRTCVYLNRGLSYGIGEATVLDETTYLSPSVAVANGLVILAWAGTDQHLNFICSTDGGTTFGAKYTSNESAPNLNGGPVLTAQGGEVCVAWTGTDAKLNVAQLVFDGATVTGLTGQVLLGQESEAGPGMTSFNGNLYLAWAGRGNNHLNILAATNGTAFGTDAYTSTAQNTNANPTLAVHNGNLYIAWPGTTAGLNVAQVTVDGSGKPTGLAPQTTLRDIISDNASLASLNDKLYLAWTDQAQASGQLNMLSSLDNGATFANQYTSSRIQACLSGWPGVALCPSSQTLYVSWQTTNVCVAQFNPGS